MIVAIVLSLISPVVAVAITVWGFRRHDRAAELKLLFDMQERYLSPRVREGRRLIHLKIAGDDAWEREKCSRDELSAIGHALSIMNTVALCAESGRISERLIMQSMGQSFRAAVLAARPYIDQVATTRGFRPYPFAERLAQRFDRALPGPVPNSELP